MYINSSESFLVCRLEDVTRIAPYRGITISISSLPKSQYRNTDNIKLSISDYMFVDIGQYCPNIYIDSVNFIAF